MSNAEKGRNSLTGRILSHTRIRKTASDPSQETVATRLNFFVYSTGFMIKSPYN